MKKAFTLLELIVVIIIIGILATLGYSQYVKVTERGRTAEARMILGQLRTAQIAYYQEHGEYNQFRYDFGANCLGVDVPLSCMPTHYFFYQCAQTGDCWAFRCVKGGKTPNAHINIGVSGYGVASGGTWAYEIYMDMQNGTITEYMRSWKP